MNGVVAEMADYFRSSKPAAEFDRVMVPGEYEHERRESRRRTGIDVPDGIWQEIGAIVDQLNGEESKSMIRIPPSVEQT